VKRSVYKIKCYIPTVSPQSAIIVGPGTVPLIERIMRSIPSGAPVVFVISHLKIAVLVEFLQQYLDSLKPYTQDAPRKLEDLPILSGYTSIRRFIIVVSRDIVISPT
jgi:hypothetical protein